MVDEPQKEENSCSSRTVGNSTIFWNLMSNVATVIYRTYVDWKVESSQPRRLGNGIMKFDSWKFIWILSHGSVFQFQWKGVAALLGAWCGASYGVEDIPFRTKKISRKYNYIYTEWKDEIWLQFHVVAINIYSTSNDSSPHVPMILALELHDITWFATTSIHSILPPLLGTSPCSPSLIFSKHFQPFPSSHAVGMAAFFKAPGPVNGGTTSWLDEGKKWRSYHPYVEKRLEVGICVFVCFILY